MEQEELERDEEEDVEYEKLEVEEVVELQEI